MKRVLIPVLAVFLAASPGRGEAPASGHGTAPATAPTDVRPLAPDPKDGGKKDEGKKDEGSSDALDAGKTGVLIRLKAGSTLKIDGKGDIKVAGPGRDVDGFWKSGKKYEPYRRLAEETGGIVTVGPSDKIYPMFDMFLARANGTGSMGIPNMDIAVAVDTTGSMGGTIKGVADNLDKLTVRVGDMHKAGWRSRLSLIGYRDKGDEYTAKIFQPFTYSMPAFAKRLRELKAGGGGDEPEAAWDAAMLAKDGLSWSQGGSKFLVLITDAPPHEKSLDGKTNLESLIKELKKEGITVYPIIVGQ